MTASAARPDSYDRTQKALHWTIALLVGAQYLAFDGIGRAFNVGLREGSFAYSAGTIGHIAAGSLILGLMAWRLGLRLTRGTPPPPDAEPAIAKLAAHAVHWAFYGLLIAMPLSGLAAWFLPSRQIGGLHDLGQTLLLGLIGMHVAAVLVHQLWWRSGLIARMT
ncbi:MAG TPA: cytochrome b/b6 domain-containing protein [Amaricoccus sp.]|nr:cytochrome b/b6 domain-containing protein [Amaricoccus sp.]